MSNLPQHSRQHETLPSFESMMGFRSTPLANSTPSSLTPQEPQQQPPHSRHHTPTPFQPHSQQHITPPRFESFDQHMDQTWVSQGKDFLLILTVGLPATGKSFTAQRLQRYLQWHGYNTHLFNLGQYRRLFCTGNLNANFFSPSNEKGTSQRDQLAMLALEHSYKFFTNDDGHVAIVDATNTSLDRRDLIRKLVAKWDIRQRVSVLWLESRCDDIEVSNRNIIQTKLFSPDYLNFVGTQEDIIADFRQRIELYAKVYKSLSIYEIRDRGVDEAFIQILDAGRSVKQYGVTGYLPTRLYFFLLNISLESSPVYLMNSDEVTHSLREAWDRHVDNIRTHGRCEYSCHEQLCQPCTLHRETELARLQNGPSSTLVRFGQTNQVCDQVCDDEAFQAGSLLGSPTTSQSQAQFQPPGLNSSPSLTPEQSERSSGYPTNMTTPTHRDLHLIYNSTTTHANNNNTPIINRTNLNTEPSSLFHPATPQTNLTLHHIELLPGLPTPKQLNRSLDQPFSFPQPVVSVLPSSATIAPPSLLEEASFAPFPCPLSSLPTLSAQMNQHSPVLSSLSTFQYQGNAQQQPNPPKLNLFSNRSGTISAMSTSRNNGSGTYPLLGNNSSNNSNNSTNNNNTNQSRGLFSALPGRHQGRMYAAKGLNNSSRSMSGDHDLFSGDYTLESNPQFNLSGPPSSSFDLLSPPALPSFSRDQFRADGPKLTSTASHQGVGELDNNTSSNLSPSRQIHSQTLPVSITQDSNDITFHYNKFQYGSEASMALEDLIGSAHFKNNNNNNTNRDSPLAPPPNHNANNASITSPNSQNQSFNTNNMTTRSAVGPHRMKRCVFCTFLQDDNSNAVARGKSPQNSTTGSTRLPIHQFNHPSHPQTTSHIIPSSKNASPVYNPDLTPPILSPSSSALLSAATINPSPFFLPNQTTSNLAPMRTQHNSSPPLSHNMSQTNLSSQQSSSVILQTPSNLGPKDVFLVQQDDVERRFAQGDISSLDRSILHHTRGFPLGWTDDGAQTPGGVEYSNSVVDYLVFESSTWSSPLKIWYAPILSSRTIGEYVHNKLLNLDPKKREEGILKQQLKGAGIDRRNFGVASNGVNTGSFENNTNHSQKLPLDENLIKTGNINNSVHRVDDPTNPLSPNDLDISTTAQYPPHYSLDGDTGLSSKQTIRNGLNHNVATTAVTTQTGRDGCNQSSSFPSSPLPPLPNPQPLSPSPSQADSAQLTSLRHQLSTSSNAPVPNYHLLHAAQLINWRSLCPMSKGILSGYTESIMALSHPALLEDYTSNKLDFRWPQGESYKDQLDRTERLIIEISRSQSPILIIAPYSSLRCIIGYFFAVNPLFIPYIVLPQRAIFRNMATAYNNVYTAYELGQSNVKLGSNDGENINTDDNDNNTTTAPHQRGQTKQGVSDELNPMCLGKVPIFAVVPTNHISMEKIVLSTRPNQKQVQESHEDQDGKSNRPSKPDNELVLNPTTATHSPLTPSQTQDVIISTTPTANPNSTDHLRAHGMKKVFEAFHKRKQCQCWVNDPRVPLNGIVFCSCSTTKYIAMDDQQRQVAEGKD